MVLLLGLYICAFGISYGECFLFQNTTAALNSPDSNVTTSYLIHLINEETKARQQFEMSVLGRLANIDQLHNAVNAKLHNARNERQAMENSIRKVNATLNELQLSIQEFECAEMANGQTGIACNTLSLTKDVQDLEIQMQDLNLRQTALDASINKTLGHGWNVSTMDSNNANMSGRAVGFTVEHPVPIAGGTYGDVAFQTVWYDSANATFNQSTGTFTCMVPGTYFFVATIVRAPGAREAYCHIAVNDVRGPITIGEDDDQKGFPSGTTSMVQYLNVGDRVNLYCYHSEFIFNRSTFSGFLIG